MADSTVNNWDPTGDGTDQDPNLPSSPAILPPTPVAVQTQEQDLSNPQLSVSSRRHDDTYSASLDPTDSDLGGYSDGQNLMQYDETNFRNDPVYQSVLASYSASNTPQSLALQEAQEVYQSGPSGLSPDRQAYYTQQWANYKGGSDRPANINALQKEAIEYFASHGWTKEQAIGIVANLTAESSMNIHGVGDNGAAYGLAQWHPDRQANYTTFAKANGLADKDIHSATFQEQLAFVNYELSAQGNESKAGRILHNTSTPAEAAAAFTTYYERPADILGESQRRAYGANQLAAALPAFASGSNVGSLKTTPPPIASNPGNNNEGTHPQPRSRVAPSMG